MKIDSFMLSISAASDGQHTLRAYRQPLERFEAFLQQKGLRIDQVIRAVIDEWINEIKQNPGRRRSKTLSPATINHYFTPLSLYFD